MAGRIVLVHFLLVSLTWTLAEARDHKDNAAGHDSAKIAELEKRGRNGDLKALFELGKAYENGNGVAQEHGADRVDRFDQVVLQNLRRLRVDAEPLPSGIGQLRHGPDDTHSARSTSMRACQR